jgi:hypothetical protein
MEAEWTEQSPSSFSKLHGTEASIEYESSKPSKGFLQHRTGMYTFSRLFVLSVFNVGHPAVA